MKKTIGIFTIILLLISLMPSRIFADSQSYYTNTVLDPIYLFNKKNNNYKAYVWGENTDVRIVFFEYADNIIVPYACSTSNSNHFYTAYTTTTPTLNSDGSQKNLSHSYTLNGVTYYMNNSDRQITQNSSTYDWNTSINTITINSHSPSGWGTGLMENIIYYTFGEGANGPEEPINFGDLKNLGFYTKFVNSQQSNISQMALNKDVISWDPFQDTNGNDLNNADYRVDIQAATIDYEASTKSDLLNQVLNDMTTGSWSELVSITPNVGQYEITWDQVAQQLWHTDNITVEFWNNLFNVYDSARGVFFKNGWIYRVRLRTADNSYVGQWQTVYNITSMPPADSDKVYTNYYVYNYTVPNEDTYEIIQNINNINNTINNWYQNDQPFNPDTAGGDWLSKLIEAILSFLGQLIHDILGLFTFESFEIPDFESNKINIINNTGLFGETLQFTDQLKQAIEDVEYVEPVLTYPGLTIDNVQLIAPMTFNLNDYVQNEEIQDIRSLAYLVTDGFIYLCLVLLIKNKIMGVLKK